MWCFCYKSIILKIYYPLWSGNQNGIFCFDFVLQSIHVTSWYWIFCEHFFPPEVLMFRVAVNVYVKFWTFDLVLPKRFCRKNNVITQQSMPILCALHVCVTKIKIYSKYFHISIVCGWTLLVFFPTKCHVICGLHANRIETRYVTIYYDRIK